MASSVLGKASSPAEALRDRGVLAIRQHWIARQRGRGERSERPLHPLESAEHFLERAGRINLRRELVRLAEAPEVGAIGLADPGLRHASSLGIAAELRRYVGAATA